LASASPPDATRPGWRAQSRKPHSRNPPPLPDRLGDALSPAAQHFGRNAPQKPACRSSAKKRQRRAESALSTRARISHRLVRRNREEPAGGQAKRRSTGHLCPGAPGSLDPAKRCACSTCVCAGSASVVPARARAGHRRHRISDFGSCAATVTWIAAGVRAQAIRPSACRRSSSNCKAPACAGEA
jgi:hypothetical protein